MKRRISSFFWFTTMDCSRFAARAASSGNLHAQRADSRIVPGEWANEPLMPILLVGTSALYIYFVGIVGVLAVVMIMYAGFCGSRREFLRSATKTMNGAVIGTILALTSLLLQLINPQLFRCGFHSFNPSILCPSSYFCSGIYQYGMICLIMAHGAERISIRILPAQRKPE